MNQRIQEERVWLVIGSLMILAAVAIAVALVYAEPVMVPFVLAIFIVTIVSPIVDFLVVRLRFPRPLAIMAALLLVFVVMAVFGFFLWEASIEVNDQASRYSEQFISLGEKAIDQLQAWGLKAENLDQVSEKVLSDVRTMLPSLLTSTLGTVTNIVSVGILVLIFVIFLLAGRQSPPATTGIYAEIETAIRRYSTTMFFISAVTGLLVGLILWAFGLPMAAVFGVLAFLLNFIPSIGSIIATLLPVPVAVAHFDGKIGMIILVVALPGAVHTIIGNIVQPKLMGKGLALHPVTVLLALVAWGLLWGPVGMVLAVPITAMIRIILVRFETTKPLGELLAGNLPGQPPHKKPARA